MKRQILNTNLDLSLIDRLLEIRHIKDKEKFLNPTWQNSWYDPFKLDNLDKAIDKIIQVIKKNKRIVVFGDYDVDWITSTYVVFYFLYKFLWYKNVSIRLPSRTDGYWIKNFHLDELKEKKVSLVITVDNGITAIKEIEYAKKLWLDVIITDHHTPLETLPDSYALINPKISSSYPFKELAGVWVAFKLITWLASKLKLNKKIKQKMIDYFLPIVAIWTVADCVPLIDENRFLVKKWLEIINNTKRRPSNISNIINFLNLKNIDSYHIGFVIGPRLNASWRIYKPDSSFQALFQHNANCQTKYLEELEKMNKERQTTQLNIFWKIEKYIDKDSNILVIDGNFNEWVIWIVAWKLTEKYNKPSIVLSIDKKKWQAIGSCRAPAYFSIIKMLEEIWKEWILERYWGHTQAGWFTIKLDNLDKFKQAIKRYEKNILPENLEKILFVDTEITTNDLLSNDIYKLNLLAPFWEKNPTPIFLIKNIKIKKIDLVWKDQKHIKIYWNKDGIDIILLKWSGLNFIEKIKDKKHINCIVQYSKDNYNWGFYFKIIEIVK